MPLNNKLHDRQVGVWQKHHTSNIFLDRQKDALGLDITGVTGMPLAYNKFLHHFNLISFNALLNKIGCLNGKNVLEIGCGTGRWSKYIAGKKAKVTAIDISGDLLKNNSNLIPEVEFINMSTCKMNFADGKFDLAVSVTVLQHMPYEIQDEAIKEICRVLKSGGHALIIEGTREDENKKYKYSFPNSTKEWINKFRKNNCRLVYHIKNTNPFLINSYLDLRRKALRLVNTKISGVKNLTGDALDTSSYDKIMADKLKGEEQKRFLFLRKIYRLCNYFIVYSLSKLSYPIEYLNMRVFRYYPTSDGGFLFKKSDEIS